MPPICAAHKLLSALVVCIDVPAFLLFVHPSLWLVRATTHVPISPLFGPPCAHPSALPPTCTLFTVSSTLQQRCASSRGHFCCVAMAAVACKTSICEIFMLALMALIATSKPGSTPPLLLLGGAPAHALQLHRSCALCTACSMVHSIHTVPPGALHGCFSVAHDRGCMVVTCCLPGACMLDVESRGPGIATCHCWLAKSCIAHVAHSFVFHHHQSNDERGGIGGDKGATLDAAYQSGSGGC